MYHRVSVSLFPVLIFQESSLTAQFPNLPPPSLHGTIRTNEGGERQLYREKAGRQVLACWAAPGLPSGVEDLHNGQAKETPNQRLNLSAWSRSQVSKSTEAENQGAFWSVCQVGTSEVGCRVRETGAGKRLREILLFGLNSIILMIFERCR